MSGLTKKLKPDRSKIDAENPKELKYWTKALDASKDEVLAAVEKVGNSAAAVRKELAAGKKLEPDNFPLKADGKKIKKQDGTPSRKRRIPLSLRMLPIASTRMRRGAKKRNGRLRYRKGPIWYVATPHLLPWNGTPT